LVIAACYGALVSSAAYRAPSTPLSEMKATLSAFHEPRPIAAVRPMAVSERGKIAEPAKRQEYFS
jgi:hypothetical protein